LIIRTPEISYRAPEERGRCAGQRRARGSAAVHESFYLYVVIAARIYLLLCYAKNFKADLTADEKKELRQLAAHLKGL
jgi:hypothetical protein